LFGKFLIKATWGTGHSAIIYCLFVGEEVKENGKIFHVEFSSADTCNVGKVTTPLTKGTQGHPSKLNCYVVFL